MEKAAIDGDVEFLKEASAREPPEYFLSQDSEGNSIFHLAVQFTNVEFMKEAMNILPTNILKQLLLLTDENSYNPLHRAAMQGHFLVINCIREICESLSWDDDEDHVKPWLALTVDNRTSLNLALTTYRVHEKCVLEIMLMDPELVSCTIADVDGNTPLHYAISNGNITKNGMNLVAEKILKSPLPTPSIVGSRDPLSFLRLATNCPGNANLNWCYNGMRNANRMRNYVFECNLNVRWIVDGGNCPCFLNVISRSFILETEIDLQALEFRMKMTEY